LCFPLSGYVTFLGPLLGALHFLGNQIFGGRDEVAATEPDLLEDGRQEKDKIVCRARLNASMIKQKTKQKKTGVITKNIGS